MSESENPIDAAVAASAQELTRQMYADVKSWLPTMWRCLKRVYRKATVQAYPSPAALLDALKSGLLHDGDMVTIECKPAHFGPFLRYHFLSPIIGDHTTLRLDRIPEGR